VENGKKEVKKMEKISEEKFIKIFEETEAKILSVFDEIAVKYPEIVSIMIDFTEQVLLIMLISLVAIDIIKKSMPKEKAVDNFTNCVKKALWEELEKYEETFSQLKEGGKNEKRKIN